MKKKFSLLCSLVIVLSVCATVTLTSFTDTAQRDVSYASLEVCYNPDDEVADMNTETTRSVIDDYLGNKVETTKTGGLLDGLGGGLDIGGIFQDGKDVISGIIGGAGGNSGNSGNSGNASGSSGSGSTIVYVNPYIDPVPAGTQNYSSAEMGSSETESETQPTVSVDPSASSTIAGDVQNFVGSEAYSIETAPDTIEIKDDEDEEESNLGVIIAIIAAIWCVVIIVIIVVFVLKKKNGDKKAAADKDLEFTYGAKKDNDSQKQSSNMSLSDLFEEANKE